MSNTLSVLFFFFLMIRRPPRSTLFPTRRSSDLLHQRDVRHRHGLVDRLRHVVHGQRRNGRSEEHTSELQSHVNLVCRLLLEKKKTHFSRRTPRQPPLHPRKTPLGQARTSFFFNDTATTEIYTLSLHDALPIFAGMRPTSQRRRRTGSPSIRHCTSTSRRS